tara:strand:- start:1132 stop:1668 length:537 start_codon:yes stop_codon:yes gene_type:complete
MKNLLIGLLFSTVTYSQSRPYDLVFGIGVDPKMALEGAHKGREGNKPSLDIEASFGFEWENTRLLTKYKHHEAINFSKWTYFAFDYKRELFNNFYGFAGLEMGQIKRTHPDAHGSKPDNYREVTINPIIFGANAELQYKFFREQISMGLQFSFYQSEDEVKEYKKYRKDVTLVMRFNL